MIVDIYEAGVTLTTKAANRVDTDGVVAADAFFIAFIIIEADMTITIVTIVAFADETVIFDVASSFGSAVMKSHCTVVDANANKAVAFISVAAIALVTSVGICAGGIVIAVVTAQTFINIDTFVVNFDVTSSAFTYIRA